MNTRICHVNLARGYRGGERQTELLVRELARRGRAQRAIVRGGDALAQRLADVPDLDVRAIRRPYFLHTGDARGCIVHAHEAKAAHFAHLARLLQGAPYIVTRRVDNAPGTGALTRRMYRRAAAVVAISSAIARILTKYDASLQPAIIPSVQTGLLADPAAVARIRARWPGKCLVGHVGALDNSQKGQLYLIRAARRLLPSQPGLQFVLLGSGKDEAWLKREAQGLSNIHFEGHVSNVADYLGAFQLFVFPSLHEGLGSVLLDAMSFGLPIVATHVDGIPDIVRDGHNGLLVPPADEAALVAAIDRLCRDEDLRLRLGEAGRSVAAQYTPQRMADGYESLYRRVEQVSGASHHG